MVKLYFTKTSCGAASFIAAFVANVSIETEEVNLQDHKTASGVDYYSINPKGNVPTLVLDDGSILNEGAAVLQYIADLAPGTVAPPNGTNERYHVQAALNYVASEVHPSVGSRFIPAAVFAPESDGRKFFEARITAKLSYLEKQLAGKSYLVGGKFSVADSYLYIVLTWLNPEDLTPYPAVRKYFEGIKNLPTVVAAHARIATQPPKTI